jgi:uncharacterized protein (UPF0335 family)
MKLMITLIVLVVIGGMGAVYIAYQHQQESSDEIRNLILEATNTLKQHDNITNTAILESRYGLRTDYDVLAKQVRDLQDSVQNFNRGALADYANDNGRIQQLLLGFSGQLALKIELVESFKSHNAILRNSIKYAPQLGEQLINEARTKKNTAAVKQLSEVNEALYRWALHGDQAQAAIIQKNADKIINLYNSVISGISLIRYANHVGTVVDEQKKIQQFIDKILAIATQTSITEIEAEYLDHYVAVINDSRKNLYYVFLYAVMVLAIAVYLGIKLKKSYAALKNRDDYRSQQISVAHKHLSNADNNVNRLKDTLWQIKDTLKYLGGISAEAKKTAYDSKKVRSLLATALTRYRSLENNKALDKADDILEKSNRNIERVSDLVKDLALS